MSEVLELSEVERVKYRIEGEFCANCSAKMERALSSTEGIGQTSINYATKTVFLLPRMREQAQTIMEQIEPGVKLVRVERKKGTGPAESSGSMGTAARKQLVQISLAGILLILGLIYGAQWHNSAFEVLEYLVYLSAYVLVG